MHLCNQKELFEILPFISVYCSEVSFSALIASVIKYGKKHNLLRILNYLMIVYFLIEV